MLRNQRSVQRFPGCSSNARYCTPLDNKLALKREFNNSCGLLEDATEASRRAAPRLYNASSSIEPCRKEPRDVWHEVEHEFQQSLEACVEAAEWCLSPSHGYIGNTGILIDPLRATRSIVLLFKRIRDYIDLLISDAMVLLS